VKITDSKVIGSIVIISIFLAAGVYFRFSDVQTAWKICRNTNPDLKYCVYDIEREGKGITQVEILTHNIETASPDDFIRWRITKDDITVYNGRFIGARAKWYVDYYKTYGTDEWVNLKRKVKKVSLKLEEFRKDGFVILRKDTEYYATKSLSGTGGHLIEEFKVGQDWHKYSVRWIPSEERMNYKHRLRWKVDSFGIGVNHEGVYKKTMLFDFDRSVVVNWMDAAEDFNFATLTSKNLEVNFKEKTGEIYIDPSIGIGRAANDFFSLESSTSQCLGRCEAVFTISNPLPVTIDTGDTGEFAIEFKKRSHRSNNLREWYIEVEETIEYDANMPVRGSKDVWTCIEGDKCFWSKEIVGYSLEKKIYRKWVKTNFNDIVLEPGETKRIKLVGFKIPKTGENDVDWIPIIAGFRISEHAWWNSNWQNKKQIFVPNNANLNKGATILAEVDLSALTVRSDLYDVRMVDENLNLEIGVDIQGTSSSTDANLGFFLNHPIAAGQTDVNYYYMYYNNPDASAPTNLNYEHTSVCNFEDSPCNFTAGDQNSGTVKFGVYSYGAADTTDNITISSLGGYKDFNYSTWFYTEDLGGYTLLDLSVWPYDICKAGIINTGELAYYDGAGARFISLGSASANTWYYLTINYADNASDVNSCSYTFIDASGPTRFCCISMIADPAISILSLTILIMACLTLQ